MKMHFDISGFGNDDWDWIAANPKLEPYRNELTNLTGVSPGMDLQRLFVYLVLLVDKESPLLIFENIKERKSEAAKRAKLFKRGSDYPQWVQEIIAGSVFVHRFKNRLLYVQHNNTWALLVSLQDAYYNILLKVDQGDTKSVKDAIQTKNDIDALLSEMNNGPLTDSDKEVVYSILEEVSLGLRPEEHVVKYSKTKSVFTEFTQ